MNTSTLATGPAIFADCPLCGDPAPLAADLGALECPGCDLHLELAPDAPRSLAAAA
jgi:hypothetical protein